MALALRAKFVPVGAGALVNLHWKAFSLNFYKDAQQLLHD
jgi:hypothetical protein